MKKQKSKEELIHLAHLEQQSAIEELAGAMRRADLDYVISRYIVCDMYMTRSMRLAMDRWAIACQKVKDAYNDPR